MRSAAPRLNKGFFLLDAINCNYFNPYILLIGLFWSRLPFPCTAPTIVFLDISYCTNSTTQNKYRTKYRTAKCSKKITNLLPKNGHFC